MSDPTLRELEAAAGPTAVAEALAATREAIQVVKRRTAAMDLMPAEERAAFRAALGGQRAHPALVAKAMDRIGGCLPSEWPFIAVRLLDLEDEVAVLRGFQTARDETTS